MSFNLGTCLGIYKLFFAFIMQIHKSIKEVGNASTNVEEVDDSVVKVEIQTVRHSILPFLVDLTISLRLWVWFVGCLP